MRLNFAATILGAMLWSSGCFSQSSPLSFKQENNTAPLAALTASEFASLGDPLFNLLLKDKSDQTDLEEVVKAIAGTNGKRLLFVVDERIVDSAKTGGRRSVMAFKGSNGGEVLDGNVMISVSFSPAGFAKDIEAWGWDNHRERYNYYKLDAAGAAPGKLVWRFRTSSEKAELKSPMERRGTCLACHVSGAPNMKELFFPWNNWHAGVGGSFKAEYLDPESFADKWPAACKPAPGLASCLPTPAFKDLAQANELEDDFLKPLLRRFASARLNTALKRDNDTRNLSVDAAGSMTVLEGRRLLRPLFETTDINLYSSRNNSGLHPFGKPSDFVAGSDILLPANQFFLNTDLIAGGDEGELGGLKLSAARQFTEFAALTQEENKKLITKFGLRLNGVPGDTQFAWLVPGESYGNNSMIDLCLQRGVMTPHFLAAVLAVDLETPVFSDKRASLLGFIPDRFDFTPVAAGADPTTLPRDPEKDLLTKAVLANIDATSPATGSPADEFRTLLKSADAVRELDRKIADYVARLKAKLDRSVAANAATREAELERLFKLLIERRNGMEAHPVLANLDETGRRLLLPLAP
jgi:hypothetical protein